MKEVKMRYLNVVVGICIYTIMAEVFILSIVALLWHEKCNWDFIQVLQLLHVSVDISLMGPISYVALRAWCKEDMSKCNRRVSLAVLFIYAICEVISCYNILEIMPSNISILVFCVFIGFITIVSFFFPIKEYCEEQKEQDSKK